MKDHEIAKIHNRLRDDAIQFHNYQCLREVMVKAAKPMVDRIKELEAKLKEAEEDIERGISENEANNHYR